MKKPSTNKGQATLAIIMWGVGLIIPAGIGIVAWANNQFQRGDEMRIDIVKSIGVLETESRQYRKDIENISLKLDKISEKLNIYVATSSIK
jgi:hypothetical protein